MNLCVPDAELITLGKLRKRYSKEMLNMLGMTKIVLFTSILMNVMVFSMFNITKLTPSLFPDSIVDDVQDRRPV